MKKLRSAIAVITLVIAVFAVLSLTASADITVVNGTVTGLDPNIVYDYAQVTLANYNAPSYTRLAAGTTKIEGLSTGLWYIYNSSTASITAVWINGDIDDRTGIGDVYYSSSAKKDVVRAQNTTSYIPGVWTGVGCFNHSSFATYYLSDVGGYHITITDAEKIEAGTVSRNTIRSKLQSIVYKYAYAPEEIIPVEELYSFGFNVGVRQGSVMLNYDDTATDPQPKTKYVLYTMGADGKVTAHTTTVPTIYAISSSKTSHGIFIREHFPNATGWVIGLDIYPFGEVPLKGLSFSQEGDRYVNTIFFIEYVPAGYTTKYKSGGIKLPFQYNGANTAYVDGYANGTFNPDGDITKAEVIAMLAKILRAKNDFPPYAGTSFTDCSVNDWFYDAVSLLEYVGGFDYTEDTRLHPNKAITRGELAQLVYSIALPDQIKTSSFADVSSEDPFCVAVASLANAGVINGYSDNTFRPYATVTRAEVVTMMNRLINLKATESTIVKETLANSFSDIEGHWAEYQILMASNSNVKTPTHLNASAADILQTDTTIQFETDHFRVVLSKISGMVISFINKDDGTNIKANSATPWFSYVTTDSGLTFSPQYLEIVDNRLRIVFGNGVEAYFIFEVKDDFFTIEVDTELPIGIKELFFANLKVNTEFSEEDESTYRLSGVTMTTHTNSSYYPGGASKAVNGRAMRKFGVMGAKLAVVFSEFGGKVKGEHRAILKDIVYHIDPTMGTFSNKGGAFTVDHSDVYGDYVILSSGFTASTAKETAQVMKKYSIDQLDMHQGTSTFIQGEFNFVCAKEAGETFTTAAQFKERVGDIATAEGIQIAMHTYSSLVPSNATTILKDPKWQKQICYDEDNVLTLASDISKSARVFPTNEDASTLTMASANVPWTGPATRYYLIDEEIVLVTAFNSTGLTTVTRGQCGTIATSHQAGAEIRQFQCWYGMFQSIPGSELFYHIADLTAKSFNEGGFEMIYLDGLESFAPFVTSNEAWYYYATFIQRVVSGCNISPIIEGSAFPLGFWTSRARGGAWDHSHRDYKNFNKNHLNSNKGLLNYYCTATLGWFHYSPDMGSSYKNTDVKTVFRDDLDHMGSIGIAFDMTTVCQPFSVSNFKTYKSLADNTMYYSLYSRLRKGGYFSPAVKKALRLGINAGKEYKLEEQSNGTWAFREMTYFKHKILDMTDLGYVTGSGTNPYNAQTPYIRIEQRYSTMGEDAQVIYKFDETAQVTAGTYETIATGGTGRHAYKIKVYGNNSKTDAVMLSLDNQLNFCIPLDFSGWREFILLDADNSDHPGYTFSGENEYFRGSFDFNFESVRVLLCGSCNGVKLDDLIAYKAVNSPASFPSITIGNDTIIFNTTIRSGEYIEYFPELNKAYIHTYAVNTDGTNGVAKKVSEISFSGSISVPVGDFSYTYNASADTEAPLRAQVVLGLKSAEIIANEDTWTAPNVELEEDLQWITLK